MRRLRSNGLNKTN